MRWMMAVTLPNTSACINAVHCKYAHYCAATARNNCHTCFKCILIVSRFIVSQISFMLAAADDDDEFTCARKLVVKPASSTARPPSKKITKETVEQIKSGSVWSKRQKTQYIQYVVDF